MPNVFNAGNVVKQLIWTRVIYTHSIPWAIHGKSAARADKKHKLYGNRLDLWVRETQDRQTGGIPVGPDTSFIIAEVIASRIDRELQRQIRRPLHGTRYIDDYHLYFATLAEAEKALSCLHRVSAVYELEVNDAKTEIIELPEPLEPSWKTQLRTIRVDDGDATSIKALFDRGFELAKQYPHDSVLTFVAKKVQSSPSLYGKSWEICEPLLLRACFGEPTMLPALLDIYEEHPDGNRKPLIALIEGLCLYHGNLHQGFEVAWSLWLAKNLSLDLSKRVGEVVSRIDDDIVALAALDLRDSELLEIDDTSLWTSHLSKDDLYSEHWLLAYEACEHNWLIPQGGDGYIGSDDFFLILRQHGVLFYDTGTKWVAGYHEPGYSEDDEEEEGKEEADEVGDKVNLREPLF
jgi:Reverse transcriptase (RNA-dependent DNA polymerase)